MYRFVTGVANLVKKEYGTCMLHDDMNLSSIIMYAQYILKILNLEVLREILRGVDPTENNNPRFKKRDPNRDCLVLLSSSLRVVVVLKFLFKLERGSFYLVVHPTWCACSMKHFNKCVDGNGSFFDCGKDGRKLKDYPTIAA